jgi:ADP-heptose:LPS heptosyltransferase
LSKLPLTLFGLHYGPIKEADQKLYGQWPNFIATELELIDLAGLMMNLDCIVTTDTMTAHLAGALGRPTFMLKPAFIDWRWGHEGRKSIWYDSMKIFRQKTMQDWDEPIKQVMQDLAQLA